MSSTSRLRHSMGPANRQWGLVSVGENQKMAKVYFEGDEIFINFHGFFSFFFVQIFVEIQVNLLRSYFSLKKLLEFLKRFLQICAKVHLVGVIFSRIFTNFHEYFVEIHQNFVQNFIFISVYFKFTQISSPIK